MGLKHASVAALVALLTACTGETAGSPGSTLAAPPTSHPSSEVPSGPAAGTCPVGQYEVTAISGKAGTNVNGVPIVAKTGGGLKLALTQDGKWTLTGDGAGVRLEAAGVAVEAEVSGTAEGSYAKSGSDYLFRQEKATGKVTLKTPVAGISSFPMDQVGPALAPDGKATLTCTADSLKIASESVVLDLKSTGNGGPASPNPAPTSTTGSGATATLTLPDSAQNQTIDCAGRDVALNGSANKFTLTGACATVSINGSKNEVIIANAGEISVNGSLNTITYGGTPKITNNGTGNTVNRR